MTTPPDGPFTPQIIAAVQRHMNVDHGEDSLLIRRGLGGQLEATDAEMSAMDPDGVQFAAVVGGERVTVHVPWNAAPTERAAIRQEIVRMYRDACATLGITPREEGSRRRMGRSDVQPKPAVHVPNLSRPHGVW